jgi:hypothetical protein
VFRDCPAALAALGAVGWRPEEPPAVAVAAAAVMVVGPTAAAGAAPGDSGAGGGGAGAVGGESFLVLPPRDNVRVYLPTGPPLAPRLLL